VSGNQSRTILAPCPWVAGDLIGAENNTYQVTRIHHDPCSRRQEGSAVVGIQRMGQENFREARAVGNSFGIFYRERDDGLEGFCELGRREASRHGPGAFFMFATPVRAWRGERTCRLTTPARGRMYWSSALVSILRKR